MADGQTIVYDLWAAQPMGSSPVSGGGAYAKRVYRALLERISSGTAACRVMAVAQAGRPLAQDLLDLSKRAKVEIRYLNDVVGEILPLLEAEGAQVFFSALPLRFSRLRFPDTVRFIYTIHGLRPLELLADRYEYKFFHSLRSVAKFLIIRMFPRRYVRRRHADFQRILDCAANSHCITVSQHSRFALLSEYPTLKAANVSTLYSPAEDRRIELDESILGQLGVNTDEYVLLICGNRWAKNPYRALRALKNLSDKGLLRKKVVVSGQGKARYLNEVQRWPGFTVCDYLPSGQLAALYKHAFAFVFPTLNEGFGYPPLECMAQGTPVITSPVNSLPELLEDAVLWADPYSIRELEGRILRLQEDADLYVALQQRGLKREAEVRRKQVQDLQQIVDFMLR